MRLLHLVVLFGRSAARIQVNVFVWASKLSVHPLRRKNSNKNVYENWSTKPVWIGGARSQQRLHLDLSSPYKSFIIYRNRKHNPLKLQEL